MSIFERLADGRAFDPDTINVMAAALDLAWEGVLSGQHSFKREEQATARQTLAKYIIDATLEGERDPQLLCDRALLRFFQLRNRQHSLS
jgi:hypothetical protein